MKKPPANKPGYQTQRAGITLVEVLLAAVVISILAIIGASALFYPTQTILDEVRRQIALNEADRDMETATAQSYDDLAATNYSFMALGSSFSLDRQVVSNSSERIITVSVGDADNNSVVELTTLRTR